MIGYRQSSPMTKLLLQSMGYAKKLQNLSHVVTVCVLSDHQRQIKVMHINSNHCTSKGHVVDLSGDI